MNIEHTQEQGIEVITLDGRLDASTSASLETELSGLIEADRVKLLLNCERLNYISSAGLRVLLAAAKACDQKQGSVVLCGLSPNVRQVFEISGFMSIFPVHESPEEGIRELLK